MPAKPKTETVLDIKKIELGVIAFHLLGTTPMIMHRYAQKAKQELLMPSAKKNAAAKAESLKHDPLEEFRQSMYRNRDAREPALLHFPSRAFSKAVQEAALDLPGATKSQIKRLVSIASLQVNVFGVPSLGMDMVRSSDMARTPDVRTRSYLKEWACEVHVEHVKTVIPGAQVFNLLAAAGQLIGLGDDRPQKGGAHGRFRLVDPDDADYQRIVSTQGRAAQEAAYLTPDFVDDDAAELFAWFEQEVAKREKVVPSRSLKVVA